MCIYVNILPSWTWDTPWQTHTHTQSSQRWDGCRRGGRSAAIRGAVCVMVAMCGPIASTITPTHTAPTSRIPPRYRTLLKTLAPNALMPSRRRGVWLRLGWQTQKNAGLCLLSEEGPRLTLDSNMMELSTGATFGEQVTGQPCAFFFFFCNHLRRRFQRIYIAHDQAPFSLI